MFGGVICIVALLLKLLCFCFGYNLPISMWDIPGVSIHPILGFILTVAVGIALFFAGKKLWKVTKKYIAWINEKKHKMLGNKEDIDR